MSVDDVDAERKRLSEEIGQIKQHLFVLSGQSSCESSYLVDNIEAQEKFKHVNARSSTTSSVRHHRGRQPTTVRQHVIDSAPASSSVHQRSHTAQHPSSVPVRRQHPRRKLLYDVHEVESESEAKSSVSAKSLADLRAQNKVVKHCKYCESGSNVEKSVSSRAVSVLADLGSKAAKLSSKNQFVDLSAESSACDSVATEHRVSRSSDSKQKQSKHIVCSDRSKGKVQSSKKKSVSNKSIVSNKMCSDNRKANAVKPSHKCSSRQKSVVHLESESKADDKSCVAVKRRTFIKPEKFDGSTPTFATFKAHFDNAAEFNEWDEVEQLEHF